MKKIRNRYLVGFFILTLIFSVAASYINVVKAASDSTTSTNGFGVKDFLFSIYSKLTWLFLLSGIGILLVIIGSFIVKHGKWVTLGKLIIHGGILMIILAIFVVEFEVLSGHFGKFKGEEFYAECTSENVGKTWIEKITCWSVGYVPTRNAPGGPVTFIVSVLVYFGLLWAIFHDIASGIGLPSNENARRVFTFAMAYVALRGWLVTYFIEFVSFGTLGLASFYVAVFIAGGLWYLINKKLAVWFIGEELKKFYEDMVKLETASLSAEEAAAYLKGLKVEAIERLWNEEGFKKMLQLVDKIIPGVYEKYEALNHQKMKGKKRASELAKYIRERMKK